MRSSKSLRSQIFAISACLALQSAHPAMASSEDGLVFAPNSPWIVDYADDSCALQRKFESGERSAWIEMRKFAPRPAFELTFAIQDLKMGASRPEIHFSPDESFDDFSNFTAAKFEGEKTGFIVQSFSILPVAERRTAREVAEEAAEAGETAPIPDRSEEEAARASEIQSLVIRKGLARNVEFKTGALDKALQALGTCTDAMLARWGIDPGAHKNIQRGARPRDVKKWAKRMVQSYPSSALRKGQSAIVRVRLMIDPKGDVDDCIVQMPVENKDFENATCRTLRRYAKFEPAIDANGNAVRGYYVTAVSYFAH